MIRQFSKRTAWILALATSLIAPAATLHAGEPERPPGRITRYDITTRNDLLLSHLVAPAMVGDIEQWSKQLLGGMPGQVGDWVNQFIDATRMANIITEAFPIEGQPGFRPVDEVVADCARTLGVDKPAVYLRNSPQTRIYTVQAGGQYHLVITSALLNLFEKRPGELKFVVGRELGHIKCGHPDLKRKAYAVLSAIQAIDAAVVPDRYQNVLPLLALGRLLTWCRESEFSADRAGLLCCGEPKAAYEAIMRLQHGLRADSPWIDPDAKGFDPQAVIRNFQDWQYQPFVKFILYIKQQPLEHPYYQERLAMLKTWADTGRTAPSSIVASIRRRASSSRWSRSRRSSWPARVRRSIPTSSSPTATGRSSAPGTARPSGDAEWSGFKFDGRRMSTSRGPSATASRSSSRSGTRITWRTHSSADSSCTRAAKMPSRAPMASDWPITRRTDFLGLEGVAVGLPTRSREGVGAVHEAAGSGRYRVGEGGRAMSRRSVMMFGAVVCMALFTTGCDSGAGTPPTDPTKETSQAKSVGGEPPANGSPAPTPPR